MVGADCATGNINVTVVSAVEHIVAQRRWGCGINRYGGEAVAIVESLGTDGDDGARNGDSGEIAAKIKSHLPDGGNVVRNSDGGETAAMRERHVAYGGDAAWNYRGLAAPHYLVGCGTNNGIAVVTTVVYCIALIHHDRSQPAAICERLVADGGDRSRDGDGSKAAAIIESPVADGDDGIRNVNGGETAATRESIVADSGDGTRNVDGSEAIATIECRVAYTGDRRGYDTLLAPQNKRLGCSSDDGIAIISAIKYCVLRRN